MGTGELSDKPDEMLGGNLAMASLSGAGTDTRSYLMPWKLG